MIDQHITDALAPNGPNLTIQPGPPGRGLLLLTIGGQQLSMSVTITTDDLIQALQTVDVLDPGRSDDQIRAEAVRTASEAMHPLVALGVTSDDLGPDLLALARWIADGRTCDQEVSAGDTSALRVPTASREIAASDHSDETPEPGRRCDHCDQFAVGGEIGGSTPPAAWCLRHRPDSTWEGEQNPPVVPLQSVYWDTCRRGDHAPTTWWITPCATRADTRSEALTGLLCSRVPGHTGQHVACTDNKVVGTWQP